MLQDSDLISVQEVRTKVDLAYSAFLQFRKFSQEQVDAVVEAMAAAARGEARRLAELAVEETGMGNAQSLQKLRRDFTHEHMLGLVVECRLTAPGNDEECGDTKREIERGQRVHGIAEPRVLAHHDGSPAGQPGTSGDRHGLALARRADIVEAPITDNAIDQRCEEAAGHTGIEGKTLITR